MKKILFLLALPCFSLITYSQRVSPARGNVKAAKPKPTPSRKIAAAPVSKPNTGDSETEKAALEAALAAATPSEKVAALQDFLKRFPAAYEKTRALESLAVARAAMADELIASGRADEGASLFRTAIAEAPTPFPDRFFAEIISRIPASLYWRGRRDDALAAAKDIESKIGSNVNQLLALANFYISTENGADAGRLAEAAIKLSDKTAGAYILLGHASRINFALDDASAAYAKALELDPESLVAKRGRADMLRALGNPMAAAELYRELIAKNEADGQSRAGLVLSLFDSGKPAEAEAELTKALEINAGNAVLLAGAAYWYVASGDGAKAVQLAERAITAEPRYIWSYIALGRGLMLQNKPLQAEKALVDARKYGNFPTLEYDIASARVAAGFYREAAAELAKSFKITRDGITVRLGGRVERTGKTFADAVADERRAALFEPLNTPAALDERLRALLDFSQKLASEPTDTATISAAADEFIKGDDSLRVSRQLYAAEALLQRRVAAEKALELSQAAIGATDEAASGPQAVSATLADELFEPRLLAFSRGDYLLVPDVPQKTLSAILRGKIEELAGRALLAQNNYPEAVIRLRRAVSVYPGKSVWRRSGEWFLGEALAGDGKDTEALDLYISSYKAGKPDVVKYVVIENLYKKVNGTLEGFEARVGANPLPQTAAVEAPAAAVENASPPTEQTLPSVAKTEPTPADNGAAPAASSIDQRPQSLAVEAANTEQTAKPEPTAAKITEVNPKPDDAGTTKAAAEPPATITNEVTAPAPNAAPQAPAAAPSPAPLVQDADARPEALERKPGLLVEDKPIASVDRPEPAGVQKSALTMKKPLFDPIVITIPKAPEPKPSDNKATPPANNPSADDRPRVVGGTDVREELKRVCTLKPSDDAVSIINNGGLISVLITASGDTPDKILAVSSSPSDLEVAADKPTGAQAERQFFVIKSISEATGLFDVKFSAVCGSTVVKVTVR